TQLGAYNFWPFAVNACNEHNSTAISIHSAEENQAAAVFAQAHNYYSLTAVWLGLHVLDGLWHWADNSTFNYANWAPGGETNCMGIGRDCYVVMSIVNGTNFGKWTGYSAGYAPPDRLEPIICTRPAFVP
ncbi:C-type lectin domain family 10 member A-like, partial [Aphelenchoides avenae]